MKKKTNTNRTSGVNKPEANKPGTAETTAGKQDTKGHKQDAKELKQNSGSKNRVKYNGASKQPPRGNTLATKGKEIAAELPTIMRRHLVPIAIVVAIVPLIMLGHKYVPTLSQYPWFMGGVSIIEATLFYKGVALQILGALILLMMLKHLITKRDCFPKEKRDLWPVIAVGIFVLMSFISALAAEQRGDAFFGGHEQFEGFFVLFAYGIVFLGAFLYTRTEALVRFMLDSVLIGGTAIGLIGTFQAFGYSLTATQWFADLLGALSPEKGVHLEALDSRYIFVQATLYNPNYVGSYVVLVLPFTIYIAFRGRGLWRKIVGALGSLMLMFTLYKCNSDAGMIAAAAGVFVAFIFLLPLMKKVLRLTMIAVGAVAIAVAAYVLISRGTLDFIFVEPEPANAIDNLISTDTGVIIKTSDGKSMRAELDPAKLDVPSWAVDHTISEMLSVTDEDSGQQIGLTDDGQGHMQISEDGYPSLIFYNASSPQMNADGTEQKVSQFHLYDPEGAEPDYDAPACEWVFIAPEPGKLQYINPIKRSDDLRFIERTGFKNRDTFANGRGYIWAHTIPRLSDHLILGAGPDNFAIDYPNDDYVKKVYGHTTDVQTNPHDLFLQVWMQDGLIALLAFLFLYGLFMIRALKLCFGKEQRARKSASPTAYGTVIVTAIAVTAYFVAGIANQSIVCIAPVYWVMLGVGYAAEAVFRRKKANVVLEPEADVPEQEA